MTTASYGYTGGYQYFTVPADVSSVSIVCTGAGSGTRQGGRVSGNLKVTPGDVLAIVCGAAGDVHSSTTGGSRGFGGGGAGGNGKGSAGGNGGGGYSAVRRGSASGSIVCVAGGAGGDSGDGGAGGAGGSTTGGSGGRGSSGSNSTNAATGGTQTQGGNGGTSSSGSQFNGANAADTQLAAYGGTGGSADNYCHGGGGGGGGYHQGGGGQASSTGYAPGGGGGGGSNYSGGLTSATNTRGNGGTGGGNVTLTYVATPTNNRPTTPTDPYVDSPAIDPAAASDEQVTRSMGTLSISAGVNDPDTSDDVLLLVRYTKDKTFATYTDKKSGLVKRGTRASVDLSGLSINTHYYVRLYAQDEHGLYSSTYNSINFWTNRPPNVPTLSTPAPGATVPAIGSTVFTWIHSDPDEIGTSNHDSMTGWELRYRTAATAVVDAGPWTTISQNNIFPTWTVNPGTFKGNTFYEWTVRTKDKQGLFGEWAIPFTFFSSSTSTPPVLLSPINGGALDVTEPTVMTWRFIDPDPGDSQSRADIRYRVVDQPDTSWINLLGAVDPGVPGHNQSWTLPPGTFVPGYHYEWQVRTYDTIGAGFASDWTNSFTFYAIDPPGSAVVGVPVATSPLVQGSLGCGEYQVFIYGQGGRRLIGEVEPISDLTFSRVRDDISNCLVHTNGFSADCCVLYANLRSWIHELVVFRDGERVWEGPITRIAYAVDSVEIEAKDVMAYVYRRIMRIGYNDSFQRISPALPADDPANRVITPTVVQRASMIITDVLAPFDPNILPYLTTIEFPDDTHESRIVADYSRTAWEEVDDLAATAGLDYTVIGRRIILWDTHRPLGRLPEMRDGDFSNPPIVTEYGMNLCNFMAVTNGSGFAGTAIPLGQTTPFQAYGPIEMVASSYSDAGAASDEVLTPAAKSVLVNTWNSQAKLNIAHRWPTPVIVRVPDNSTLNPDIGVGFDQLIPGVWIPLRSDATCRVVEQWQKLDSLTVTFNAEQGEQVSVVMSPAPGAGQDPDADQAAEEANG